MKTISTTLSPLVAHDCIFAWLPEDAWQAILLYLEAPDILALLCVNRHLVSVAENVVLWQALLKRDGGGQSLVENKKATTSQQAKQEFVRHSCLQLLPVVTWHALGNNSNQTTQIWGREAHLATVLGDYQVVTQGFTDDEHIYYKHASAAASTRSSCSSQWQGIRPTLVGDTRLSWAYGCTLTPLEQQQQNPTAIRFGGFQSGGYSHETHQIGLLRLHLYQEAHVGASWKVVQPRTHSGQSLAQWDAKVGLARAYHAAQMVLGRYLIIVGGIRSRIGASILQPVILDTFTWTWMDQVSVDSASIDGTWPSGRHGCSIIWDEARQRIVMFGGGKVENE